MNLLADYLQDKGVLSSPQIIKAFKNIDRKDFVPEHLKGEVNVDAPLPIGYGQTISQPYTVAFMLELLKPQQDQQILDVGSGSGWQTGLLASIVGTGGHIFALERIPELLERSRENLKPYGFSNITFIRGDAWQGIGDVEKFDRIIVAAAAPQIPPVLKSLLKTGGRLVIPLASVFEQDIVLWEKLPKGKSRQRRFPGFVFVPLVKE